jgi:hypothetical protein
MASFASDRVWWRLPWDFFFSPSRFGGGGHFSFLVMAVAPALLFLRHSRPTRWLGGYTLLFFALWLAGPHVLRYASPLAPALSLLAALGLIEIEDWARSKGWARVARAGVLLGLFLGAAQTTLIVAKDFDPFRVVLGIEKESDYLARRGVGYAGAAAWLAERAPQSRLVVLGGSRSAYLPSSAKPPLVASVFEAHPFKAWLEQASSPQELDEVVARKGYDGVLIDAGEWRRVESGPPPHYDYFSSPEKKALFEAWLDGHAAQAAWKGPQALLFFVKAGTPAPGSRNP